MTRSTRLHISFNEKYFQCFSCGIFSSLSAAVWAVPWLQSCSKHAGQWCEDCGCLLSLWLKAVMLWLLVIHVFSSAFPILCVKVKITGHGCLHLLLGMCPCPSSNSIPKPHEKPFLWHVPTKIFPMCVLRILRARKISPLASACLALSLGL